MILFLFSSYVFFRPPYSVILPYPFSNSAIPALIFLLLGIYHLLSSCFILFTPSLFFFFTSSYSVPHSFLTPSFPLVPTSPSSFLTPTFLLLSPSYSFHTMPSPRKPSSHFLTPFSFLLHLFPSFRFLLFSYSVLFSHFLLTLICLLYSSNSLLILFINLFTYLFILLLLPSLLPPHSPDPL